MRLKLTMLLLAVASIVAAQSGEANYNVVVAGHSEQVALYSDYPFAAPEDFAADKVAIHRTLRGGYETFYLPFSITYNDIPSNNGMSYIYTSQNETEVTFMRQSEIAANVPFLMTEVMATSPLSFCDKQFVASPTESSTEVFAGNYRGTVSANGRWGIGNENKFVRGADGAFIKSFAASLSAPANNAKAIVLLDATTAVSHIAADSPQPSATIYSLSGQQLSRMPAKGIVIVNNKKVLIR